MENNKFCFISAINGKYIAMDSDSGYPYETDREQSICTWNSIEDASDYKKHFPEEKWVMKKLLGLNLGDL